MNSKSYFFISLFAMIMTTSFSFAQVNQVANPFKFDAAYDFYTHTNKGMDVPFASVTSVDGYTYITGTSADYDAAAGNFVVICVNTEGELVWEKRLPVATYSSEYGLAITLDELENPIVSGVKWNGHDMDMITLKLNATDGEIIWESIFAGDDQFMEVPSKIATDNAGNILITGITYTGENATWLTLKYNSSGSLQWYRMVENNLTDSYIEPKDMHINNDGSIGITGYHGNSQFYQCYYTIVYSDSGETLWSHLYEDEANPQINSVARGITADPDGNWYVTGILNSAEPHMHTLKYDQAGNIVWENTLDTEGSQGLFIENGADDVIYAAGRHASGWVDDGTILASYNYDGTENWIQLTNDLIDVRPVTFTMDASGNPIISGWGYDAETFDDRLRALRYDSQGNITGEWAYNRVNTGYGGFTEFLQLASDEAGDLYLTFKSFYTDLGGTFEVAKVSYEQDAFVWDLKHTNNGASAIQLLTTYNDAQNNTYFTGMYDTIIGIELYRVYVVSKYSSSGSFEWEQNFSGLNDNLANGIQMRVAENGDLVVFLLPEFDGPMRIKKYNTHGELQWEKEEMPGSTMYEAFTLDKNGSVIMAGNGQHEGNIKFLTRKISADGEDLWTSYDARPGYIDELNSVSDVKTDASGNIYLTGKAGTGGWISQETDITILKYSPAGELIWLSYFPEENMNTTGRSLYISADGDVFVNGYVEDRNTFEQQLIVMRLNQSGEQIWKQNYTENGRRVNSYETLQLSNGDIIVTGFSVIDGLNNKVIMVKYDEDGNFIDVYETEFYRFHRDVHLDAADNLYLFTQMTSSPYPMKPYYSAGAMPLGTLVKLTPEGELTEEFYYGPELSDFFPCMLLPMPDGRLMLSGTISNEMSQFGGVYFFESEHITVGINEPGSSPTARLGQPWPNPAKEYSILPVNLEKSEKLRIELTDISGRKVMVPFDGFMSSGNNQVKIDVSRLEKGTYIYTVGFGESKQSGKLLVK